jgi:hypothetical protein
MYSTPVGTVTKNQEGPPTDGCGTVIVCELGSAINVMAPRQKKASRCFPLTAGVTYFRQYCVANHLVLRHPSPSAKTKGWNRWISLVPPPRVAFLCESCSCSVQQALIPYACTHDGIEIAWVRKDLRKEIPRKKFDGASMADFRLWCTRYFSFSVF